MIYFVEATDIVGLVFNIISGLVGVVALIIAIKSLNVTNTTLRVTNKTLKWFQDDRINQDKKEFRNEIIFKNIQSISTYILFIVKTRANMFDRNLEDLDEAQKNLVIGRTYIGLYAKAHDLPYLKEFCEINEAKSNESFMFNVFKLNKGFINYCNNQKKRNKFNDGKLDYYQTAFEDYLQLAMDYSTTVLFLGKNDEINKYVDEYKTKLRTINEFCASKGLI